MLERDCLLLTPWRAPWATQADICLKICKTILSFPEDRVQVGGGQLAVRGASPGPGLMPEPPGVHPGSATTRQRPATSTLASPSLSFLICQVGATTLTSQVGFM